MKNLWYCWDYKNSAKLILELELEEEVTPLKSMPLDKPFVKESSLSTKNSLTNNPKGKSKRLFYNMTEPY